MPLSLGSDLPFNLLLPQWKVISLFTILQKFLINLRVKYGLFNRIFFLISSCSISMPTSGLFPPHQPYSSCCAFSSCSPCATLPEKSFLLFTWLNSSIFSRLCPGDTSSRKLSLPDLLYHHLSSPVACVSFMTLCTEIVHFHRQCLASSEL